MSKRGPTGFEALKEIGKRMNDLADVAKTALEQAEKSTDAAKEFTITTGDGQPLKGVMGFSTRSVMGAAQGMGGMTGSTGDAAQQAEFRPAGKADIDDAREPLIDIYDEGSEVVITAELPGVSISDLVVNLNEQSLTLETTGSTRFHKQIELESAVDAGSITHSLRNGILEIRLTKQA